MTPETPDPADQADSCDDCGQAVDDHDLREGRGCNVCRVVDPCSPWGRRADAEVAR